MSPPAVLPDEADAGLVRMCDMLSCPRTSDNLVTLASCMEAYGGSSQAALEDPLETWRGWKDFLEYEQQSTTTKTPQLPRAVPAPQPPSLNPSAAPYRPPPGLPPSGPTASTQSAAPPAAPYRPPHTRDPSHPPNSTQPTVAPPAAPYRPPHTRDPSHHPPNSTQPTTAPPAAHYRPPRKERPTQQDRNGEIGGQGNAEGSQLLPPPPKQPLRATDKRLRSADVESLMGISSARTKITTAAGQEIDVYYPFMLFNSDILMRILSALQPALVSFALHMAELESKPTLHDAGPQGPDQALPQLPDLYHALSHMMGKHKQGRTTLTDLEDPACRALRQAYQDALIGRTGDEDLDIVSEGNLNSWVQGILDARNKLMHSKYNVEEGIRLHANQLEHVMSCAASILESHDPRARPHAFLATSQDPRVIKIRETFRVTLDNIHALGNIRTLIARARALAAAGNFAKADNLFYSCARPGHDWASVEIYRPTEEDPLLLVPTRVILPVCAEKNDVWRFVSTILETGLRPLVVATSSLERIGRPAWTRVRGSAAKHPDLQSILKHMGGMCIIEGGGGRTRKSRQLEEHYLELLLGKGTGASWQSHSQHFKDALKEVLKTRNKFAHLNGTIVADSSSIGMEEMFHTILRFLDICRDSNFQPLLKTDPAYQHCTGNIEKSLQQINKVRTMWGSIKLARQQVLQRLSDHQHSQRQEVGASNSGLPGHQQMDPAPANHGTLDGPSRTKKGKEPMQVPEESPDGIIQRPVHYSYGGSANGAGPSHQATDVGSWDATVAEAPLPTSECPMCFHQVRCLSRCQPCDHTVCDACAQELQDMAQQALRSFCVCPICKLDVKSFIALESSR